MTKRRDRSRRNGLRIAAAGVLVVAAVIAAAVWSVGSAGGYELPDFSMTAYQGTDVLGSERTTFHAVLDQGRPVVLNFWASNCPPCREEMPGFQRVHDEFEGAFTMLGVDVGTYIGLGTQAGARAFLSEYGIDYPAAFADDGELLRAYEIFSMPTTLLFDASGALVDKHAGYLPEAAFRRQVEALLATTE